MDWNRWRDGAGSFANCHSLCRSVDWNKTEKGLCPYTLRHSLCRSVDWNKKELEVAIASGSLLVQECGLKQGYQKDQLILLTSSLYEGVDCNDLYIQNGDIRSLFCLFILMTLQNYRFFFSRYCLNVFFDAYCLHWVQNAHLSTGLLLSNSSPCRALSAVRVWSLLLKIR